MSDKVREAGAGGDAALLERLYAVRGHWSGLGPVRISSELFDDVVAAVERLRALPPAPGGGEADECPSCSAWKGALRLMGKALGLPLHSISMADAVIAVERLAAPPSAAPHGADVEQDAKRYRWLRASQTIGASTLIRTGPFNWSEYHGAELDAAIDAALRDSEKPNG